MNLYKIIYNIKIFSSFRKFYFVLLISQDENFREKDKDLKCNSLFYLVIWKNIYMWKINLMCWDLGGLYFRKNN